jgi:hypothetical protein
VFRGCVDLVGVSLPPHGLRRDWFWSLISSCCKAARMTGHPAHSSFSELARTWPSGYGARGGGILEWWSRVPSQYPSRVPSQYPSRVPSQYPSRVLSGRTLPALHPARLAKRVRDLAPLGDPEHPGGVTRSRQLGVSRL